MRTLTRSMGRHLPAVLSLYGLQIATLVIPLLLLPFLTRQLGPAVWGVLAVQTSLSTLMIMFLEFGFGFGATRDAAAVRDSREQLARIVSAVVVARVLLSTVVVAVWLLVWVGVPLVREQALAYWLTLGLTLVQGYSPSWFFQSIGRLPYVMVRELGARVTSTVLIVVLVRGPEQAWMVPAFQMATIACSLAWSSSAMLRLTGWAGVKGGDALRIIRSNAHLCLTRFVQGVAPMGNTFLLGIVLPGGAASYAAAERAGNAVRSLLAPVSQVAFPEIVVLHGRDPAAAQVAVRRILLGLVGASVVVVGVLWLLAPIIVSILFGSQYQESTAVLRVLLCAVPLFGVVQVVGLQWLLPLKFDRTFIASALAGVVMNLAIGLPLSSLLGPEGMAFGLLASEFALATSLLLFTELIGPSKLRLFRGTSRRDR